MIIAGDGYAYVPYSYTISEGSSGNSGCGCGCTGSGASTQFLNLLRVGPTGDSYEISLGEYSSAFSGYECNYQGSGSSYSATATLPTLITNADQGVLASYSATYNNSPTSYYLATTSGASLTSNVQVNILGQMAPVQPVLQRADGSYIGTVANSSGNQMVAFTFSGSTLWGGALNDTPQVATSDGGVIGASGTTYDQNGDVTGQRASLPTQSWRGNSYQLGSIEQVSVTPTTVASLWSWVGGSPSPKGTAGRPWFFKLVWQNAFVLYPDNPTALTNLSVDATLQAAAIKRAALAAFKKAFQDYPVDADEGTPTTGDNRANVVDGYNYNLKTGESCGLSSQFAVSHDSKVYYRKNMEASQWALPILLYTAQDVQRALNRSDLMIAIGTGIGNNAAHEVAHQFFLDNDSMDDNSTHTYNGQGCDGEKAPWVYGIGTISWEGITDQAWKRVLGTGWHK